MASLGILSFNLNQITAQQISRANLEMNKSTSSINIKMSAFNKRDRNDQEVTEEEKNVAQIKVQKSDK